MYFHDALIRLRHYPGEATQRFPCIQIAKLFKQRQRRKRGGRKAGKSAGKAGEAKATGAGKICRKVLLLVQVVLSGKSLWFWPEGAG